MKIEFKLTNEAIKNELLKGNEIAEKQILNVVMGELTQKQREMLITLAYNVMPDLISFGYRYFNSLDLFSELEIITQQNEKKKAETILIDSLKNQVDKILKALSEKEGLKIYRYSDNIIYIKNQDIKTESRYSDLDKLMSSAKEGLIDELIKFKNKIKTKQDRVDKEKAKKEAYQKAKAELKAWAEKEGSELVQMRIKHEQNWVDIAVNDYVLSKALPDFRLESDFDEFNNQYIINNATIEQLQVLDNIKLPANASNVHLRHFEIDSEDGYFEFDALVYCHVVLDTNIYLIKDLS